MTAIETLHPFESLNKTQQTLWNDLEPARNRRRICTLSVLPEHRHRVAHLVKYMPSTINSHLSLGCPHRFEETAYLLGLRILAAIHE